MNITKLIHERRAYFVPTYDSTRPVSQEVIAQLLDNAQWAPTHKLTEPWRFQVFHSPESRAQLGDFMAAHYERTTPPAAFSALKRDKAGQNPRLAAAVIALCMQRDPENRVPEFEEVAAVAMAVQNMWLTCTEMGLGCYWSTHPAALEADVFLGLQPEERCLGLLYLGWPKEGVVLEGKRTGWENKTVWR